MASSRKSLGISIFFPFPPDGDHCAHGSFHHSRNCFIPFLRCMLLHNSLAEYYGQFLGLHWVSALTCNVNCGTSYGKVCFFLNHVQSIELATGGLQSSCRDISRIIKGNLMHLISIWSVITKALDTYWCKTFQLFIFHWFLMETCFFHFVIMGYFA